MKWLATVMCLLAVSVTAQEIEIPQAELPERQVIPLPFIAQCTPVPPDQMLEQVYEELGFLEGDASIFNPDLKPIGGKLRMFLNPNNPRSYTIIIELGPNLHCLLVSGENIGPMVQGNGI